MKLTRRRGISIEPAGLSVLAAATMLCAPARAGNVDTELVILVDAQTYSQIDFDLILDGVAKTFEAPDFYTAVMQGGYGKIASSVMLYNLPNVPVALSWTELTTQQDFFNFASSVRSIAYPNTGWGVDYANALTSAAAHFDNSTSVGTTQQITIIDDGTGFYAANPSATQAARNGALASGVDVINAMVFDAQYQEGAITSYYESNIVSSNGSVNVVSTPQGGPKTSGQIELMADGINVVVAGPTLQSVPEPSSALLFAFGGALLAGFRRRGGR